MSDIELLKKNKSIFTKIFLPIAIIIVLFAIISIYYAYYFIDINVKNDARIKIEDQYNELLYLDINNKLLHMQEIEGSTIVLFNDTYEFIKYYDDDKRAENNLIDFISGLLLNYELNSDIITTIKFENKEYLAKAYQTNSKSLFEAKYIVILQSLSNKKELIKRSLRNILIIYGFLQIILLIVTYMIAKDISIPLKRLSVDSNRFTIGNEITISNKKIGIKEVESLRETLQKMQKSINEEDKEKNIIYENVAHDLRTPLVSILGYADGIRTGIVKDTKKAANIIIKTGNQLKMLVENILLLSRFQNKTYEKSIEEYEMDFLLNEQIEQVKFIDTDKNIIFNKSNDTIKICIDKKIFERIMQNLLSNAIRHANKNITISLHKEKNEIRIVVNNDGNVLSEDVKEHLFERYYKGENGNSGIGLSLVKEAISYINGKIEVISNLKDGTSFIITLKNK